MTRDAIATDKLAAPVGPFSLGVRGGGLLFLSGQVAGARLKTETNGHVDRLHRIHRA
jgi:hypothetical protein